MSQKSKADRAAYMRNYRKTAHYKEVELPKHRARNRAKAMIWRSQAEDRIREKEQTKVIKWLYNYWRTLKSEGMTEKQFIIRFDNYLSSLVEGHVIPASQNDDKYAKNIR